MSRPDRWIEFDDAHCLKETPDALFVDHEDFGEPVWFPKSQCDLDAGNIHEAGDCGKLVVTRWICEQKDLLED